MRKLVFLVAGILSGLISSNAFAQNLGDLLGGILQATQSQAAQEAWSREVEARRYCVDRSVTSNGNDLSGLIRAGILPTDPRLSRVIVNCRRLESSSLRINIPCTVRDERGDSLQSTCNQVFVRNGQTLSERQAVDLFLSNSEINIGETETDSGRSQRLQRFEARQRAQQIAAVRSDIERLVSSPFENITRQARTLLERVQRATAAQVETTLAERDSILRDLQRLQAASSFEEQKQAAVEPIKRIRDRLDRALIADQGVALPAALTEVRALLDKDLVSTLRSSIQIGQRTEPSALNIPSRVGPAFDCDKARNGVGSIICLDDALRRLDLELNQAFYAVRHQQGVDRNSLRDTAGRNAEAMAATCRVPAQGVIPEARQREVIQCVGRELRSQSRQWRDRLQQSGTSEAREEISRTLTAHLRGQALLVAVGALGSDTRVDGVFGVATRSSIADFQTTQGIEASGYLSAMTMARLEQAYAAGGTKDTITEAATVDSSIRTRIAQIETKYAQLLQQVEALKTERDRERSQRRQVLDALTIAREGLRLGLPVTLARDAEKFVAQAEAVGEPPDSNKLAVASTLAASLVPQIENAIMVARATTAKSRFLIDGDDNDVIILVNSTGKAPSVLRNLRGEWDFQPINSQDVAPVICQFGKGFFDVNVNRFLVEALVKQHPRLSRPLNLPAQQCEIRQLAAVDFVVLTRRGLSQETPSQAVALLTAVDSDVLLPLVGLPQRDFKAAQDAELVKAVEIENSIERGGQQGYGFLANRNNSLVVCMVHSGGAEHEAAIRKVEQRVIAEVGASPSYVLTTSEAAFVATRRGQCRLIYAAASDLLELRNGMRRERMDTAFLPIWIAENDLTDQRAQIENARVATLQTDAERARRRLEQDQLNAMRTNESGQVRERKQKELREQNGALARALETTLRDEIKSFVGEKNTSKMTIASKYPSMAKSLAVLQSDAWEILQFETQLQDYGIVGFRGRTIEAAFANSQIRLRNRILGEYKTVCWTTGFIDDKEFSMHREPFNATCETEGAIRDYKRAQGFSSRWVAN